MRAYWFYGAALVALGVASYWVLLRIEIECNELRMVYPCRTVTHSFTNLNEISVVQRFQEVALRLELAGKPFEIGESQMMLAPEQLASTLEARHGSKVRYL